MRRALFVTATLLLDAGLSRAQSLPTVPPADFGKWEQSSAASLSPNGKWLAYAVTRVDERSELRVRALDRDSTRVISQAGSPLFAATSRYLAYSIAPTPDERERLEKEKKPVRNNAGYVDLASGKTETVSGVTTFRFSADGRYLALRTYATDATKRDAAELLVRDLVSGATSVFGNVASFAWSDVGATVAITIETESQTGNGVQVFEPASGRLLVLAGSPDKYRGLAWRKDALDLAVLRSQIITGTKDTTHAIVAWRGVGTPKQEMLTLDATARATDLAGVRVAEQRTPEWTRDGRTILFGVRPLEGAPKDSAAQEKKSDVVVWRATDVRTAPMKKAQDAQDRRRTLLATWRLADGKLVRVGTELQENAVVLEGGRFATETSHAGYEFGQMFGRARMDVDVIDLESGARRRAIEKVRYLSPASPAGRYIPYFRDGAWWVYDLALGKAANLSGALSADFTDRDDDHPTDERGPVGFAGWTRDDRSLFVYDKYDVWRLTPSTGKGERLTNGRGEQIMHRLSRIEREPGFDPARPLYFTLFGEWTKQSGFARLRPGANTVERLLLADASHRGLIRADSAPIFAFLRTRFDQPANWYAGTELSTAPRVSDLNAFQKEYAWGRAELVDFRSDSGARLQGALYYPANYDPSRKYPMIVNTYEILSNTIHDYQAPSERSYYNRTAWTQRGYFVFTPDIVFRPGDPGRSVVECIVPAVRAVIAKGLVDSARIGLVGHSWGGYEAAYVPTQTNLFATSIAGAPITNFLSFAGAVHWSGGFPELDHWETGQARMVVPPWEDMAGHLRNSPANFITRLQRPMLMVFGDADGTVDWHQGVEFYNFARRAGKNDFTMLVYPGEDHGLRKKENQIDYHRRIFQWFDHYLKGAPAPDWISKAVGAPAGTSQQREP